MYTCLERPEPFFLKSIHSYYNADWEQINARAKGAAVDGTLT